MSNELTNNEQLRALQHDLQVAINVAMRRYHHPLTPSYIDDGELITETIEDRAESVHDELWSALVRVLVEHAQPGPSRAATEAAILDYVAVCIGSARAAAL
jgi:hypothetical protein